MNESTPLIIENYLEKKKLLGFMDVNLWSGPPLEDGFLDKRSSQEIDQFSQEKMELMAGSSAIQLVCFMMRKLAMSCYSRNLNQIHFFLESRLCRSYSMMPGRAGSI